MSNIKRMKDKDGNYIYPVTHASAVFDGEGNTIEDKINNTIDKELDEVMVAVNKIEPDAPNVGYIAHRGYSAIAPENTIPAYEEAGEAGFWGAETDIAETLDGEFVLMHDATVDRTTNGTGNVADMTLEQIKALTIDAGSNIAKYPDLKVPTLREYLTCCKRYNMVPIIECKTINNIEGFYNILQELNMVKQVIVISFQNGTLQALREFSKDIRIQTLSPGAVEAGIALCKQYNFDVDLNEVNVTEDVVKQYHNNGIKVNVWTVNNDTRRLELESFGVDYITTDNLISRKMKIFQSVKNHDATISDMQQTIDMLLKLVGSSTEDYGAMTEYVQRNYDITRTGSKSDLLHSNGTKADAKFPSIYTSWSGNDYYKRAAYPFLFVGKKQIRFEFDDDYKISVHTFDTDGNRLTDGGWTTDSGSIITIPDELFGLFVARKDDAIFNLDYVNEFLSSLVITVIGSI